MSVTIAITIPLIFALICAVWRITRTHARTHAHVLSTVRISPPSRTVHAVRMISR
jgi:hypothetical protein